MYLILFNVDRKWRISISNVTQTKVHQSKYPCLIAWNTEKVESQWKSFAWFWFVGKTYETIMRKRIVVLAWSSYIHGALKQIKVVIKLQINIMLHVVYKFILGNNSVFIHCMCISNKISLIFPNLRHLIGSTLLYFIKYYFWTSMIVGEWLIFTECLSFYSIYYSFYTFIWSLVSIQWSMQSNNLMGRLYIM